MSTDTVIRNVTPDTLNDVMDFDRVIHVHVDGTVSTANNVMEPTLYDDELEGRGDEWTFASTGYTGQYGYNGPIMHNSEQLNGRLASDILATPGYYVALVSDYSADADGNTDENETYCEGWAIAYMPESV